MPWSSWQNGVRSKAGLDNFKGLFQLRWFCDSVNVLINFTTFPTSITGQVRYKNVCWAFPSEIPFFLLYHIKAQQYTEKQEIILFGLSLLRVRFEIVLLFNKKQYTWADVAYPCMEQTRSLQENHYNPLYFEVCSFPHIFALPASFLRSTGPCEHLFWFIQFSVSPVPSSLLFTCSVSAILLSYRPIQRQTNFKKP